MAPAPYVHRGAEQDGPFWARPQNHGWKGGVGCHVASCYSVLLLIVIIVG